MSIVVEKSLVIEDPSEQERLWSFYEEIFRPINEETPITQSFPKKYFLEWLTNPRVFKFIARRDDQLAGFGAFTDNLDVEPLLSLPYFQKHYPDRPIMYCPVLAVAPGQRGRGAVFNLLRAMLKERPPSGVLVFLHSKTKSLGLPRLFDSAGGNHLKGKKEVENESCWIYHW